MRYRTVKKIVIGNPTIDGAGVRLVRVLGPATVEEFDPFLMLDAFDSANPEDYVKGFPWHPHRGIETVTFLIEGDIEHGDSLGNKGSIRDGCCQWMTAGSGIIHQEMPQASPRMLGLQLWINLPARLKMTAPKYRDLGAERIPVATQDGARIAIIAGSYRGEAGAMRGDYVDATMLDIALEAGGRIDLALREGDTAFAYIVEGSISFDPGESEEFLGRRRAVLFTDGEALRLAAPGTGGARCMLVSGAPLHEPVAWGGPIVMNTREELDTAFRELEENTFIRHD